MAGWPWPGWEWIPAACSNGHEYGPGKVILSFIVCDCAAVSDGRGRSPGTRLGGGCDAAKAYPPGHVGPVPEQR